MQAFLRTQLLRLLALLSYLSFAPLAVALLPPVRVASSSVGTSARQHLSSLAYSSIVDNEPEFLTDNQLKELRKEASKRAARKSLTQFFLPQEQSSGEFSDETIKSLKDLLSENELVQVRSISRDNHRHVFEIAEELAVELHDAFLIQIKGHAATYYVPGGGDNRKIQLRTKYKPNAWTKKPKAKRDRRGQVIPGEYE